MSLYSSLILLLVLCESTTVFCETGPDSGFSNSNFEISNQSSIFETKQQLLISNEMVAKEFLDKLDKEVTEQCSKSAFAEWIHATDITPTNRANAAKARLDYMKFWKQKWKESEQFDWSKFEDPLTRRQFKRLSVLGTPALPEEDLKKFNSLKQKLEGVYSTARICNPSNLSQCNLALEPEITELMMYSRNETELKSAWVQWRRVTGKKMRKDYEALAIIMSEVARVNKFSSVAAYETRSYETPHFITELEKLWSQLEPFYQQLHAYVRFKLGQRYGTEIVSSSEPIPSHLLGNMWAQSWGNIFDLVVPFPNVSSIDATPALLAQNVTPTKMAKLAEEFFVSLGFPRLPQEFWTGSILQKPTDKEMVCHASSWDMCDQKNFWIKQCTRINMEDFVTLHHEMGHTMYQIQYKSQPKVFRDGANAAFHEAIGDLIALSVQTPKHLQKIGFLKKVEESREGDLNHLMLMALEKIAFLPFGLLVDKWRWGVFDGNITAENYNCEWWKLRNKYQGVSPAERRSEDDFDPGSKYHVAANVGYIRYFISTIIQFQFHHGLCKVAGQFDSTDETKPLYKCDIFGSMEAGEKLMRMLQLGSSVPWPDAMEIVTTQRVLDAGPILDYFKPLIEWLLSQNEQNNVTVGWTMRNQLCSTSIKSSTTKKFISSYFIIVELGLFYVTKNYFQHKLI